jgi:hypothetical protein
MLRISKKSIKANTADKNPIVPWTIPVIVVRIVLVLILNHLRQSIIPANKSINPIDTNSKRESL